MDFVEKLLDIEKTKGACFGYRLGSCKGACTAKELPVKYNFRFNQAFYQTKVRPWPFNGPIIIKDCDDSDIYGDQFLIDKWCI